MRPHAHDQVAALQAHVDQLKKEKDRLMDDKEEAMELFEWAECKLQEATERIEQLEMQLSAFTSGTRASSSSTSRTRWRLQAGPGDHEGCPAAAFG